jgi:hypothetical protein
MTITRTMVRTWLKTARLPITLAESTLHRGENTEEWPPALAFGAFESGVKQVVGSLIRDRDLANEGRVERAQVAQLRKASELDAIAEVREVEADAELRARQVADAQRAESIEAEADARREAEARRRDDEKRRAEEKARRAETVGRKADAETAKSVARAERSARTTRVEVERKAVAKKRGAVAAKKAATKVEKRLEATKSVRRSGDS